MTDPAMTPHVLRLLDQLDDDRAALVHRFEYEPHEDGEFTLVTIGDMNKPSCVLHGAMNKMSESPPDGTGVWRCITTNSGGYRGQTGGCRAGCHETPKE